MDSNHEGVGDGVALDTRMHNVKSQQENDLDPWVDDLDPQIDALANELWLFILDEKPELAVYRGIEGRKRGVLDSFTLSVYARRKVGQTSSGTKYSKVLADNKTTKH